MGNTVTVAEHAINVYKTFMVQLIERAIQNGEARSAADIPILAKSIFAFFMEDFVMNDETYVKFSPEQKTKFLGALCYYFAVSPLDVSKDGNIKSLRYVESVTNAFCENFPTEELLAQFVSTYYSWNGKSFCHWEEDKWVICTEDRVNCDELVAGIQHSIKLDTCGINSDLAVAGVEQITAYLAAIKEGGRTLSTSERHLAELAKLKANPKEFNGPSMTIPGNTSIVDATDCTRRPYEPADLFTVRLNYDAATEETDVVHNFRSALKCKAVDLAAFFVRCGVSAGRTLTVVSGPKGCGKTTVLRNVKALFGPFICTQAEYEAGTVNLKQIRTCLVDDNSFPSEKFLREHQVDQLVVTCESCDLTGTFSGRKVTNLKFTGAVKEPITTIVEKLSSRKQLGALLGWSLATCHPVGVKPSDSEMDKFKEMLVAKMMMDVLNKKSEKSETPQKSSDSKETDKTNSPKLPLDEMALLSMISSKLFEDSSDDEESDDEHHRYPDYNPGSNSEQDKS